MLVIGNGESRTVLKTIPTNSVGCNALHRDNKVAHLICVDRGILQESLSSNNTKNTTIYTRKDWFGSINDSRVKIVPDLPYTGNQRADNPWHWGSGPYAVLLAATLTDQVELVGFDLYSTDTRVNNVYKGTQNYSSSNNNAVDPRYWIYQISQVFRCFPDKYFTVYNRANWKTPKEWSLANVQFKNIDILLLD
jgi:hypothetical protein